MADDDMSWLKRPDLSMLPDSRKRGRDDDEDDDERRQKRRKTGLAQEAEDAAQDLLRQIRQSREALQSARPDLPDEVAIEILKYMYGEAKVRQAFGLAPQK